MDDSEAQCGTKLLRDRSFHRATPHLHAAAWAVARSGVPSERLESQVKLADAQLHAREFHSALANYRYAERLAGEVDPDAATYWGVRASLAQALRRLGRIDEARIEGEAVASRLAQGAIAGDAKTTRLIARMTENLQAQLAAMRGDFAVAGECALALAQDFVADGDVARAAAQYYNAALWCLFAAERAGAAWRPFHQRASVLLPLARELIRALPVEAQDETCLEIELLLQFVRVMGVKLENRADEPEDRSVIAHIAAEVERLALQQMPANPSLRLGIALISLRLAQRLGRVEEIGKATSLIRCIAREHQEEAARWVDQSLSARFRWDRVALPLATPDPGLRELLAPHRL